MKYHYFLLASTVYFRKDNLERSKPFNILIRSTEMRVNSRQLGQAQQQAQIRYYTEVDIERKTQVTDVFVMAISYIGHMTDEEFQVTAPQVVAEDEPVTVEEEAIANGAADPAVATDDTGTIPVPTAPPAVATTDPYGIDDAGKNRQTSDGFPYE